MDFINAFKYTKKFSVDRFDIIPSENNINYIVYLDGQKYLFIYIPENDCIISKKIFTNINVKNLKNIDLNEFKNKYFLNHLFEDYSDISIYKYNQNYVFTSNGFISLDDFFLAKDIIEQTEKIKKRDIIENNVYKDIRGKKVVYIKNQHPMFLDQLFDLNKKVVYNRNSLSLIEDLGSASKDELKKIKLSLNRF